MKELLDQYAHYNIWAHKRLTDLISTLDPEKQHQEIESSFNSLYNTIFHVWGAETVWLQRLNKENQQRPDDLFNGSMKELAAALEKSDQQLLDWTLSTDENQLKEKLAYSNLRGDKFFQAFHILLMHIFNHSTYHNGQIVTMLRQLKVEKIPETDFVAWSRL